VKKFRVQPRLPSATIRGSSAIRSYVYDTDEFRLFAMTDNDWCETGLRDNNCPAGSKTGAMHAAVYGWVALGGFVSRYTSSSFRPRNIFTAGIQSNGYQDGVEGTSVSSSR